MAITAITTSSSTSVKAAMLMGFVLVLDLWFYEFEDEDEGRGRERSRSVRLMIITHSLSRYSCRLRRGRKLRPLSMVLWISSRTGASSALVWAEL